AAVLAQVVVLAVNGDDGEAAGLVEAVGGGADGHVWSPQARIQYCTGFLRLSGRTVRRRQVRLTCVRQRSYEKSGRLALNQRPLGPERCPMPAFPGVFAAPCVGRGTKWAPNVSHRRSGTAMARPTKPWFRASKNGWYVTVDGRKVSLGVRGES